MASKLKTLLRSSLDASYDQLFDEVFADLKGVECDWGAVCEVLHAAALRHDATELPNEVLNMLLTKSAKAMGFWDPSAKLLSEMRKAILHKLKEHDTEAPAPEEAGEPASPTSPKVQHWSLSPASPKAGDSAPNEVVLGATSTLWKDGTEEGTAVLVGMPPDQAWRGSTVAPTLLGLRGSQSSAKTINVSGFTLQEKEKLVPSKVSGFILQEEDEERAPSKVSGLAPADENGERKLSEESQRSSHGVVGHTSTESAFLGDLLSGDLLSKVSGLPMQEQEERAPSKDSAVAPADEIGERAPSKASGLAPADGNFSRQRSKESRRSSKRSMVSKRSANSDDHERLTKDSGVSATLHFAAKGTRTTIAHEGKVDFDDGIRRSWTRELLQKLLIYCSSLQFHFRSVLVLLTALQMILYAVYPLFFGGVPKSLAFFGWPLAVAKASAYGACFWTALLFLSMSRDLITILARISLVKRSEVLRQLVSSSKEIHIFSAGQVMINSCLHTLMHHIGTFVTFEQHSGKELNKVLNCAQAPGASMPVGYLGSHQLTSLQFPACPLPETDEKVGYLAGVLSTPGITGYMLMAVIILLGWFSRPKGRRLSYRVFYAMHHLLVTAWVLLLVVHAANDWVGVGVPVVLLIAGLPMLSYAFTRAKRLYLSCLKIELVKVVRSESGQLLRLDVDLPRSYRHATVGEYAYINVPKASRTEWHPFTIAGMEVVDGVQRITFIIMAAGIWTKKVHEIIKPEGKRADLHIDGPYFAPAVTIQAHEVVVGIGGGVGVTPFLSFLSNIASDAASNFKRAHIFWTTRTASDYKIMSDLFSKLEERMQTRGGKLVLHLHCTPKGSIWKGDGIGSLFDLATRHIWQKRVDNFIRKDPTMIPTIARYPRMPLHAVVVNDILHSGNPVAIPVGRPDFTRELKAVGNQDPHADVGVYVCAAEPVKQSVEEACLACNRSTTTQKFRFNYERFS
ncbi:unnamed protein product [Polarella glacialis]|uniref:FAD-binding FR-type domain-containing protein n=1 Tax=Polarella glacialis TaxID=89957 RepID=A0A813H2I0_POLGL|nr:unnamed protein product [Polarella glacialis]